MKEVKIDMSIIYEVCQAGSPMLVKEDIVKKYHAAIRHQFRQVKNLRPLIVAISKTHRRLEVYTCKACSGLGFRGKILGPEILCRQCGGEGVLLDKTECKSCRGKGTWIIRNDIQVPECHESFCHNCNGTGIYAVALPTNTEVIEKRNEANLST